MDVLYRLLMAKPQNAFYKLNVHSGMMIVSCAYYMMLCYLTYLPLDIDILKHDQHTLLYLYLYIQTLAEAPACIVRVIYPCLWAAGPILLLSSEIGIPKCDHIIIHNYAG